MTPEEEEKHKKMIAKIKTFCLMDDLYMNVFFDGQLELIQFVLRIILNISDLVVSKFQSQKAIKNMKGRSTTLDMLAEDGKGNHYNIEVQNDPGQADPERAEYHMSLIVSESLLPNQPFSSLPETYVIFILKDDYYKEGKPFYTADRTIKELDNRPFGGKTHIIYVNGAYDKDDSIGLLMRDFKCRSIDGIHYPEIRRRAFEIKGTKGGNDKMCQVIRDMFPDEIMMAENRGHSTGREEGRKEGREEGRKESAQDAALKMLKAGKLVAEEIPMFFNLSADEVRDVLKIFDEEPK